MTALYVVLVIGAVLLAFATGFSMGARWASEEILKIIDNSKDKVQQHLVLRAWRSKLHG